MQAILEISYSRKIKIWHNFTST